jgi:hypothetical protein
MMICPNFGECEENRRTCSHMSPHRACFGCDSVTCYGKFVGKCVAYVKPETPTPYVRPNPKPEIPSPVKVEIIEV